WSLIGYIYSFQQNQMHSSGMDDQIFFEEAAAANGDRGLETQTAFPLPKWVDPEKIKAGQKFIRDHFF
ncbi:unnamed protein product, partial [Allacma fusca]